jgi:hypothetical protein
MKVLALNVGGLLSSELRHWLLTRSEIESWRSVLGLLDEELQVQRFELLGVFGLEELVHHDFSRFLDDRLVSSRAYSVAFLIDSLQIQEVLSDVHAEDVYGLVVLSSLEL